jgi:hypothetical protein
MFIRTDKISEIVNDSDSDGSSFSEISDSDTCTVEYILTTRYKTFLYDNHTDERASHLCGITEVCSFCSNVSGYVPHIIDNIITE